MTGRDGLKAELRTDKNGHAVTRWVRDGAMAAPQAAGRQSSIPAPRRGLNREAAISTILKAILRGKPGRLLDKHEERLGKFADSTLEAIVRALRTKTLSPKELDDIVFVFREDKELRPMVVFAEAFHPDSHWDDRADIAGMLNKYPPFEGLGDPSLFTGPLKEQATDLVKVASVLSAALFGRISPRTVMERLYADPDLCDRLVADPAAAEALAPVMKERGWLSSAEAAAVLAISSPLRGGML